MQRTARLRLTFCGSDKVLYSIGVEPTTLSGRKNGEVVAEITMPSYSRCRIKRHVV